MPSLVQASMKGIERRGEGGGITIVEWASALLYNGLGRYADAVVVAERAAGHPEEFGMGVWALPELIEAAARNEEPERLPTALERLSVAANASGTHWALGLEARSRALVSADALADPLYRKAIDHLSRTRARFDLALNILSTANGCAGRSAAWMLANTSALPTNCSRQWGSTCSPNVAPARCAPPAELRPCQAGTPPPT